MTGFSSNVTYTAFDGSTWNMRVYEGKHTSFLIPDSWFPNFPTEINLSYGAGPWPGLQEKDIAFLLTQIDRGYEFYTYLTGHEPAENSGAPNNLLRIAFLPELGAAAGLGLIGIKGIELGKAALEHGIYAAERGQVNATIFWHEMGRNFGVGSNDVGVKYVLVDELNIKTFMSWFGTAYEQFSLDQNYLLPRYYLADPNSGILGVLTPPYTKPYIPPDLLSGNFGTAYNGGDVRSGIAYQFYLEQGLQAYKQYAEFLLNNTSSTPEQFIYDLVAIANQNASGLDYSYLLKNGSWQINSYLTAGPKEIQLSKVIGKIGVYDIFSSANDTVTITSSGQFRLDGGDGYDQVFLPFKYDSSVAIQTNKWVTVVTSKVYDFKLVLDFFEKLSFSDGQVVDISVPYNSLFPVIKEISQATYSATGTPLAVIKIAFSEPVNPNVDPTWGQTPYNHYISLTTDSGSVLQNFVVGDTNAIISGSNVFLKLPSLQNGSQYKLKFWFDNIPDAFGNTSKYKITPDDFSFVYHAQHAATDIPITNNNSLIYRLYEAAFARCPDEAGFRFWVDAHNKGWNVSDIASCFVNSSEFQQKYGIDISNNEYVYALYQNILGREPDAAGLQYWQDNLNSGKWSREEELSFFASSIENVGLTAVNINNGYWVTQ
jgi:hypothetical protein